MLLSGGYWFETVQDASGKYSHQPLRKANDAIGVTTDELVEGKSKRWFWKALRTFYLSRLDEGCRSI
jgi:hypothetical protein